MSDSEEDVAVERQIKISLVGEPSTGKSMLCARYVGAPCPGASTAGAEVLLGECHLPGRDARPHPIKICDVAGSQRASSMLDNYLYASHIIILVYDVTNYQSFERLVLWMDRLKEIFSEDVSKDHPEPLEQPLQPLLALFGNKCDLEHQRAVRMGTVKTFAEDNGLVNFTGSGRTSENVNIMFVTLVAKVLGIPINRSYFINSTVMRAELAPNIRNPATNTKTVSNEKKKKLKKNISSESVDEKQREIKNNKKNKIAMKELKKKASSAVCTIQ